MCLKHLNNLAFNTHQERGNTHLLSISSHTDSKTEIQILQWVTPTTTEIFIVDYIATPYSDRNIPQNLFILVSVPVGKGFTRNHWAHDWNTLNTLDRMPNSLLCQSYTTERRVCIWKVVITSCVGTRTWCIWEDVFLILNKHKLYIHIFILH